MRADMSYRKIVLAFFACFVFSLAFARLCAAKDNKIDPAALITRALSREILWQKGFPPTLMRADLRMARGTGGKVLGEYGFYWAFPSQWREEVKLGTYYRIRVGSEKGYWQVSNLQYQPEVVFELDGLLSLKKLLKIAGSEPLSKVHVRKRDGISEYCAEVKGKRLRNSTLCFDESTGELLSVDYPMTEIANPSEISRLEYSGFKAIEGKSIAFEIHGFHGREPVLGITITKIAAMPEHDAGLFERPAQSQFWATCDELTDAALTHMVFPDPPRPVEFTKSVTLYLVVEADGTPSHITVIQGQDPGVEAAAIVASRQWRYKPAMCGKTPVRQEIETALTVGP
ncbi:MAG: energy transducer TonB [Candidatus Acidiferrales bacterium]